jgi:serine protease Do
MPRRKKVGKKNYCQDMDNPNHSVFGRGFYLGPAGILHCEEAPPSFADLVKRAGPGVVNIIAAKDVKTSLQEQAPFGPDNSFRDFFDRFFGDRLPREYRQDTLGTGFIMTNNHVVESATELRVKLADNKEYMAVVVGQDAKTDLALIRIEPDQPLTSLPLGDSDALQVGDWVVAIGNPFGLGNTVTSEIVSAKYRQIGQGAYVNFIQTDTSVNPGNSGGPLLDMNVEVIGINSAIFSQSGGSIGIGFAIPINLARDLLPQLRQGKVRRSYLGVVTQDVTPELRKMLTLGTDVGALVSDIIAGGPASKSGIQRGDVIVAFEDQEIRNSHELPQLEAATPIGKKVILEVMRKNKNIQLQVTTEELPEETLTLESQTEGSRLGLTLQAVTPELAQRYSLPHTNGLLILQVDEQVVSDVAAFNRITTKHTKGESLLLLVDHDGITIYVTLAIF